MSKLADTIMPAPAHKAFAEDRALFSPTELDVVTLKTPAMSDDGALVPAGATGTIVAVYGNAAAFGVEFEIPIHAIATVYPQQIGSYRRAG
ncbi:hypothetical protein [Methylobacterium sp. Gmos1]